MYSIHLSLESDTLLLLFFLSFAVLINHRFRSRVYYNLISFWFDRNNIQAKYDMNF
jgi:hypothetical protein